MQNIQQFFSGILSIIILLVLFIYSSISQILIPDEINKTQITINTDSITLNKGAILIYYKEKCKNNYDNCSILKESNYSIKPVYVNCAGCYSKKQIENLPFNILDIQYLPSKTKLPIISAYKVQKKKAGLLEPNTPFIVYLLKLPNGNTAELMKIDQFSIEQQSNTKIDMIDLSYKLMTQANPKVPFNSVKQYCIAKHQNKNKIKNNIDAFKKVFSISDNSIFYQENKCLLNIEKGTYVPAINIVFKKLDDFLLFEHYSQDYGIHGFRRY